MLTEEAEVPVSGEGQKTPENNASPRSTSKVTHSHSSTFSCCHKGRDFENLHTNHVFSSDELQIMSKYESMNYLPQNSKVYRKWLNKQNPSISENHWDKWVLMSFVGFATGIVGYLLKSLTELITKAKFEFVQEALDAGQLGEVFAWIAGISIFLVLVSSCLVVFIAPEAAGSGVPAVIGYLNGVYIHHLFDIRVFVVKFMSTLLAVSSGLPVGPEGPMVYMGGTLGKQLSQGNSKTCPCYSKLVKRFHTMQGRRDFISAGSAAGIASAFGAPVGGMLFAMEEVASFWNLTLAWQILFCCMTATFTTEVLQSYFGGFEINERGQIFGTINEESGILFSVKTKLSLNILIFVPTIAIGILGGALGAGFTFISLKINRFRRRIVEPRKWLRILEPVTIVLIMSIVAVYLPANFKCQPTNCHKGGVKSMECLNNTRHPQQAEVGLHRYTCPKTALSTNTGRLLESSTGLLSSNDTEYYNPAASLLYVTGESAVEHLFSRNTVSFFNEYFY
jgi:chloride channel 7